MKTPRERAEALILELRKGNYDVGMSGAVVSSWVLAIEAAITEACAERDAIEDRETAATLKAAADGIAERDREIEGLKESLKVSEDIGGTFWEALKPLKLQAINVMNPGSHVTDLIRERDEARKHAREHHLEACESCAVTEADRDAAIKRAEEAEAIVRRHHGTCGLE